MLYFGNSRFTYLRKNLREASVKIGILTDVILSIL